MIPIDLSKVTIGVGEKTEKMIGNHTGVGNSGVEEGAGKVTISVEEKTEKLTGNHSKVGSGVGSRMDENNK